MKIVYKDLEFELTFNNLSGLVAKEFYRLTPKLSNNNAKAQNILGKCLPLIDEKEVKDLPIEKIAEKAFMLGVVKGVISQEEYALIMPKQLTYDEQIAEDNIYRDLFRTMINKSNLDKAILKLIESDNESDFWQSLDILQIEAEVKRFRTLTNR